MKITAILAAAISVNGALAASPALAWDQDFFGMYFQRSDKILLSEGNAKEVNAATQVIDPWPRYVGVRKIRSNGARMAGAVERYRDYRLRPVQPPIGFPATTGGGGAAAGGGGAGGGAGAGGAGGGAGAGGAGGTPF
jgi:hypothetical protein